MTITAFEASVFVATMITFAVHAAIEGQARKHLASAVSTLAAIGCGMAALHFLRLWAK